MLRGMWRIVGLLLLCTGLYAGNAGERHPGYPLFRAYCWGCHHQTAEAFGPSFRTIASKRTPEQIMAQIADPEHTYRLLGYRRNSMPAFADLNATQLKELTDFILSFKETK